MNVHPSEWELTVSRGESRITYVRLRHRDRQRSFELAPGDTLDLRVFDGAIEFRGHNPLPSPEPPIRVELIDLRLK